MYSHTAHVSKIYHILEINEQSIIKQILSKRPTCQDGSFIFLEDIFFQESNLYLLENLICSGLAYILFHRQTLYVYEKPFCQKWDSNPRPHTWTRMLLLRKEIALESGALDRSAILRYNTVSVLHSLNNIKCI